jgi:hypothetical protein
MESGVVRQSLALVPLHATARLTVTFQYQHTLAFSGEQRTAHQTAKTTAYDYYIEHFLLVNG